MKVTKGETILDDKEVIAFYTGFELVFRDLDSDKNYAISNKAVYKGEIPFKQYLKISKDSDGFIAFYKGDTINIQLQEKR